MKNSFIYQSSDLVIIDVSTPTFPKSFCLIDPQDIPTLDNGAKWRIHQATNGHFTVAQVDPESKRQVFMHRVIMGVISGSLVVDHINGNTLDNRRINLRTATRSENLRNAGLSKRNTSGYKGVYLVKETGKWRSMIYVDGKNKYLGRYPTKEAAAKAYDKAAERYYGEFAKTNANILNENRRLDMGATL